jgi:predicted nucleic acid-binding protein
VLLWAKGKAGALVLDNLSEGSLLHVDACCWIDLFSTDCIEEIIRELPYQWTVSEYVFYEEVLTVVSRTGVEEKCNFQPLIDHNLISVLPIRTAEEKQALVQFAEFLDDGEASTCALAHVHGGGVATNDKKVRSVIARLMAQIPVVQTPEIIFRWAQGARVSQESVRRVLKNVTLRARFSPRKDAPHADWWYANIED